jgi:uncharacterized membrane protein YfcA
MEFRRGAALAPTIWLRKHLVSGIALLLVPTFIVSCSSQPMTVDQELTTAAIGGVIGAASGAIFANQANQSYPASIFIGAAGIAGIILLYEEVRREAAEESTPDQNPPVTQTPSP